MDPFSAAAPSTDRRAIIGDPLLEFYIPHNIARDTRQRSFLFAGIRRGNRSVPRILMLNPAMPQVVGETAANRAVALIVNKSC